MNAAEFDGLLRARTEVAGIHVDPDLAGRLFQYVALLRHWNKTVNLTALSLDPLSADAVDRLIVEPLTVAAKLPGDPIAWVDLGSGGGSPALPIKLAHPRFRLTMVESKERKAAFLREAVRTLQLPDATVANVRFSDLRSRADLTGSAHLITLRAVRIDTEVLAVCAGLLAPGGLLVPMGFTGDELPSFERDVETGFFRYVPRET